MKKTSICVTQDTKEKLKKLKGGAESFDTLLNRTLLKDVEIPVIWSFELTHGIFSIMCEAELGEWEHWYFLDPLGNRQEILKPFEKFQEKPIQKEYLYFIDSINEVARSDVNLIDYGGMLEIGESFELEGFIMKRTA